MQENNTTFEINIEAKIENQQKMTAFIEEVLEKADCPMKAQMHISVAADEIFSNIAYYAYPKKNGSVTIKAEIKSGPKAVEIKFIDSGIPFDPLSIPEPDVTKSAEERSIGGLGIFMVKKMMDEVSYEYSGGKNILTIKKYL